MDFVKGRRCKDLNFVYVADDGTIACSSPRAMLLNIKFQQNPEEGSSSEDADRVSSEATNDEDLDDAKKNAEPFGRKGLRAQLVLCSMNFAHSVSTPYKAIYCKHCQMWLNGPTQWADHEIGKKHRKAVHRQQGTQAGHSAVLGDGIELDEEDVEMNQGSVLQQEMYDYQSFAQDQGMQQFQFQ
eukprot:g6655.t1